MVEISLIYDIIMYICLNQIGGIYAGTGSDGK